MEYQARERFGGEGVNMSKALALEGHRTKDSRARGAKPNASGVLCVCSIEPTHKFKQGSFNGKPKATFPLSFDTTVAFGLPLNEFMRLLYSPSRFYHRLPVNNHTDLLS